MKLKQFLLILQICLAAGLSGCENGQHAGQKKEIIMKKRVINPWTWQDKYGFVQANEVTDAQRMLFCAGQISVDDNGNLLHPGDMKKQVTQIANNLETLFEQSNVKLSDIVRITYYTTDIEAFTSVVVDVLVNRFEKWQCRPATSLIGISQLARPGCVIEFEVTAAASTLK